MESGLYMTHEGVVGFLTPPLTILCLWKCRNNLYIRLSREYDNGDCLFEIHIVVYCFPSKVLLESDKQRWEVLSTATLPLAINCI